MMLCVRDRAAGRLNSSSRVPDSSPGAERLSRAERGADLKLIFPGMDMPAYYRGDVSVGPALLKRDGVSRLCVN